MTQSNFRIPLCTAQNLHYLVFKLTFLSQLLSPIRSSSTKPPITSGNLTISRREHLIAEEIPGPESCV